MFDFYGAVVSQKKFYEYTDASSEEVETILHITHVSIFLVFPGKEDILIIQT
jgi:hypothetical protein